MNQCKKILILGISLFVLIGCSNKKEIPSPTYAVQQMWGYLQNAQLSKIEQHFMDSDEDPILYLILEIYDYNFYYDHEIGDEIYLQPFFTIIFCKELTDITETIAKDSAVVTAKIKKMDVTALKEEVFDQMVFQENMDESAYDMKMKELFTEYAKNPKFSDETIELTFSLKKQLDTWTILDIYGLEKLADDAIFSFMDAMF